MLHGCTIGDGCLVGIGAVVLNGARIGKNCLVGARSLVTEGKEFPEGSMILGSPAKVVRPLRPEEITGLQRSAEGYVKNARRFSTGLHPPPLPSLSPAGLLSLAPFVLRWFPPAGRRCAECTVGLIPQAAA